MAKKTQTFTYDDIDGTEGAETVTFSYDSKTYEIDLSDNNRKALEKALRPYIEAGRSAGGARRSSSRGSNKQDLDAIRTWARENGHTVSDRGRIAANIVEAYEAANK